MRKSRPAGSDAYEKQLYMELFECMERVARKYGHVNEKDEADGNWVMENYHMLPERDEVEMRISTLRNYNLRLYGGMK